MPEIKCIHSKEHEQHQISPHKSAILASYQYRLKIKFTQMKFTNTLTETHDSKAMTMSSSSQKLFLTQ
jgi:hypothetical protein